MEHIAALHAGDHVRRKSRRDTPVVFEYRPELTTCELIAEVLRLLDIERGAERLVCRYLADLADRVQWRQERMLDAYADELHAARCCFGLGPREARERVRIGRALRQLPEIERALVDGELSYSRVREITRVASADTEAEWLELARQLDMRTLERRVVGARRGEEDALGAETARGAEPTAAKKRRVTFELSEEAWALLERALESARRASGENCSDGEALEVVARAALTVQGTDVGPHELANAGGATAANTAAGTTVSASTRASGRAASMQAAARAVTKPVRPWSWDDLGWGATHSGDGESGSRLWDSGWGATQRGSSNARNWPSATGGSRHADRRAGRWPHDGDSNDADSNDADSNDADSPHSDAHCSNCDSVGEQDSKRELERDAWGEINSRLLQAMGGRGRWNADRLIEASGLSAREVNVALTYLQLGGRIRRRDDVFEPI